MAKNLIGESADATVPAVKGDYKGAGAVYVHNGGKGIQGHSHNGYGVHGISVVGRGVVAESHTNYGLRATSKTLAAARCTSSDGNGVEGEANGSGAGILGTSKNGIGVHGISETAYGIQGESSSGRGVAAFSDTNYGLRAVSRTLAAARCTSTDGNGVEGEARGSGAGIVGTSTGGVGVFGKGGKLAARFEGDVEITGDIRIMNADFAEDFDVFEETEPGDVMVLTDTGSLTPSKMSYDRKVVGIISGAGSYKPGIILDRKNNDSTRKPVAMIGKVFCKVDADISPIEIGDMLTSSNIPGYAMKVNDYSKAFGAVIGKALHPLKKGKGLIPVLITLQ